MGEGGVIGPAPPDLWDRVAKIIARMVYERETNLERTRFSEKLPHLVDNPPQARVEAEAS